MEYAAEGKKNEMELVFDSLSENEGFARVAVAAFMTPVSYTHLTLPTRS